LRRYTEADLAGLASKSALLQGLLSAKLSVRRQVDSILTAAAAPSLGSLRNPETLRGLDPAVAADVMRFRRLWADHSMLRFKMCDLRIFLLGLELCELDVERQEINQRIAGLRTLDAELRQQAEAAQKKKLMVHGDASAAARAEREERNRIVHDVNLRQQLNRQKFEELQAVGPHAYCLPRHPPPFKRSFLELHHIL
jgi:hypothetical protein